MILSEVKKLCQFQKDLAHLEFEPSTFHQPMHCACAFNHSAISVHAQR